MVLHIGRITHVGHEGEVVPVFFYNAFGGEMREMIAGTSTLPNGVTVGYSVDNDSRITGLTYSAGSTQLGNLTYGYDADGRVTSKNGTLAAIGLPTTVSGNTFNADNGMTAFGGATLSYDANGNLISDGTNTYTWDARNHLTAISGAVAASFTYDAFGRRASKTIAGATTQFLYDWWNPAQELQGGVPSANLLTGLRIDEYFARTDSSNNVSTLLPDALGSTIGLVGSGQSIATSYTYEPFGATTVGGAANGNSYQFTGRENDGIGSYFYRARYYQPTYQRFVSQDPLDFDGGDANLYDLVGDSPTVFVDPLGLISRAPTYPGLPPGYEGPCEKHHIIPKYLGGDENGPTILIPTGYHRQITQAFKDAWPYAPLGPAPPPTADQLLEILITVYELYPIVVVPLLL